MSPTSISSIQIPVFIHPSWPQLCPLHQWLWCWWCLLHHWWINNFIVNISKWYGSLMSYQAVAPPVIFRRVLFDVVNAKQTGSEASSTMKFLSFCMRHQHENNKNNTYVYPYFDYGLSIPSSIVGYFSLIWELLTFVACGLIAKVKVACIISYLNHSVRVNRVHVVQWIPIKNCYHISKWHDDFHLDDNFRSNSMRNIEGQFEWLTYTIADTNCSWYFLNYSSSPSWSLSSFSW